MADAQRRAEVVWTGSLKVQSSALRVRGTVPGISREEFQKAAEDAKAGCPVSGALKGNVEITLEADLAG